MSPTSTTRPGSAGSNEPLDLIIVGGGPAGMAAALVAGRARLRAAIVNEERPRNAVTAASHGFLTRDGAHPSEILAVAKTQLARYPTVQYLTAKAVGITARKDGGAFALREEDGAELHARRVVLATGARDDLASLRLPGIEAVYGKSVFPCPFCDGYEHRDERIAAFGGEGVEQHVPVLRMWSDDVHVFTNGRRLSADAKSALARNRVPVHESPVERLDAKDGRLTAVRLADGNVVERDVGFLRDSAGVPASTLAGDLGVARKEGPRGMVTYDADDFGRTSVAGLYVVGDLRVGFARVTHAASEGARCAEQIVHEIAMERWS